MKQTTTNIVFLFLILGVWLFSIISEASYTKEIARLEGLIVKQGQTYEYERNKLDDRLDIVGGDIRRHAREIEGLQYWSSKDCPQGTEKVIASPGIDSTIVYPSLSQYTEDKGITINEIITDSIKAVCIGKKIQDEILEIIDTPFITK